MTPKGVQVARLHKRAGFVWHATILRTPATSRDGCTVLDVSDAGACVKFQMRPPDFFILNFTKTGTVQRLCRMVWCQGDKAGVEFVDRALVPISHQ